MSYSFLIVEDEPMTSRFIKEILIDEGYDVAGIATSADEARKILHNSHIDVILLDINIKGAEDGLQFAKSIAHKDISIIFISAYSDKNTLHESTFVNPCGFLVKPFKEDNLLAVLSVVIADLDKKQQITTSEPQSILINHENKSISYMNETIQLTNKELRCIELFINNPNKTISLSDLHDNVWDNSYVEDSTLRELIKRIRKKVHFISIESIYAQGYLYKP